MQTSYYGGGVWGMTLGTLPILVLGHSSLLVFWVDGCFFSLGDFNGSLVHLIKGPVLTSPQPKPCELSHRPLYMASNFTALRPVSPLLVFILKYPTNTLPLWGPDTAVMRESGYCRRQWPESLMWVLSLSHRSKLFWCDLFCGWMPADQVHPGKHNPEVGFTVGRRRRRRPTVKPTLCRCICRGGQPYLISLSHNSPQNLHRKRAVWFQRLGRVLLIHSRDHVGHF